MDASDLRALQAPLKEQYRDKPDAALVTSRASADVRIDGIACQVDGWLGETEAGMHPAAGGDGSQACSADMLLESLVACAGVTLKSVATAMGVALHDARIEAEGDWDARGTLGVDRETPVGLTAIRLQFVLESDADDATIERLIRTTERYCVIFQTLKSPPALTVRTRRSSPSTAV